MKRFVTMVFVGFTSLFIAQTNSAPLEFVNETNETILLTFMNDSLKIEYPQKGMKTILSLDKELMEVEGTPFYIGILESDTSTCEIAVQFLEEIECSIDSDCDFLTKGVCKLKEKNPFGVYQYSPGNGTSQGDGDNSGSARRRQMIRKPNTDNIQTDETCLIVLRINIDGEGNIIGTPVADMHQTTTTNTVLIKKVIELVKKESKYTKASGKAMESMTIRVQLKANNENSLYER